MKRVACLALLGVVPLITGCPNAGESRVLAVQTTGIITASVYFDVDGSRTPSGNDLPFSGVKLFAVSEGAADTVGKGTSDAQGGIRMAGVPVGTYRVLVDSASVGDSVSIVSQDSTQVTVRPGDSVNVLIAVSYPIIDIAQFRALTVGKRAFVEGVALDPVNLFGDSTFALVDTSGTILVTRVRQQSVGGGDSVRVFGTRNVRTGQAVLDAAVPYNLDIGTVPAPVVLATGVATTADSGRYDAALVKVVNATITDTMTTVLGDYVLTVDDSAGGTSGPLVVVLDADANLISAPYVPSIKVDAIGLLVPTDSGTWALKPRANTDLAKK